MIFIYESQHWALRELQAGNRCILGKIQYFLLSPLNILLPIEKGLLLPPFHFKFSHFLRDASLRSWEAYMPIKILVSFSMKASISVYQFCSWISVWFLFGLFQKLFLWFAFQQCTRSEKHPNLLAKYQENIALTREWGLCFSRTFLCIVWVWE